MVVEVEFVLVEVMVLMVVIVDEVCEFVVEVYVVGFECVGIMIEILVVVLFVV